MAPMALDDIHSIKRSSSTAQFDAPPAKRQFLGPLRHHKLTWKPSNASQANLPSQDAEVIQSSLTRSIALALEAVGFQAADPVAIESFCAEAEEYMAHFLASVRRSMISSRRTRAVPEDYLHSLHAHQLTLRSILPHLDPPVSPTKSQIPWSTEIRNHNDQQYFRSLELDLNETDPRSPSVYIPRHFPAFPSKHTYKSTPEFTDRENDPRKIRERATEEGRMGEEALRRLVGAGSQRIITVSHHDTAKMDLHVRRDVLWKETMLAVAQDSSAGVNFTNDMQDVRDGKQKEVSISAERLSSTLSSVVNGDRKYWRKSATRT